MTTNPDGASFHWCSSCDLRVTQTHECPTGRRAE